MKLGAQGQSVEDLHDLLTHSGYEISDDEYTNSKFGKSTDEAVRKFQIDQGLSVDGVVGPKTISALEKAVATFDSKLNDSPQSEPTTGFNLTKDQLTSVLVRCRVNPKIAPTWGDSFSQALTWGKINSGEQVASLLANALFETGNLTTFQENLNYSVQGLMDTWPNRFDYQLASKIGRSHWRRADQVKIANLAYGDRYGNRGANTNDGYNYRGQGPFQLTFKDNYKAFQDATGYKVVDQPTLLSTNVHIGAHSAVWFWNAHECGELADAEDWDGVRRIINGGDLGSVETARLTLFIRGIL